MHFLVNRLLSLFYVAEPFLIVLLTIYLFLYNTYSAIAWLYPLVIITLHLSGITRGRLMAKSPVPLKNWVAGGLFPFQLAYGPASTVRSYPWAPEWLAKTLTQSETTYAIVGEAVKWIQTAAILEILHSALGWVRSPVMTTAMQVASRIVLVWGIADQYPSVRSKSGTFGAVNELVVLDSYEPDIHFNGLGVVVHRSDPICLLCLQCYWI